MRQFEVTVTNTVQFTHLEPLIFEEATHFPIAAFVQANAKPRVTAFSRFGRKPVEARRTVLELDAAPQPLEHVGRGIAADPNAIFTFDLARGMHEAMGQLAVIGE